MSNNLKIIPTTSLSYCGQNVALKEALEPIYRDLYVTFCSEAMSDSDEPELYLCIESHRDDSDSIVMLCIESYEDIHSIMNYCKSLLKSHDRAADRLRNPIPDA